jgi:hypothetical protein
MSEFTGCLGSRLQILADTGLTALSTGGGPARAGRLGARSFVLPLDNCLVDGVAIGGHRRHPDIGADHYPLSVDLVVPRAA